MVLDYNASRESTATEAREVVGFSPEQTQETSTLTGPPVPRSGRRTGRVVISSKYTGGPASGTYAPSDTGRLERQLTYLQAQCDGLESEIRELQHDRDRAVAHVAGDEVALFILAKVVQAGVLDVGTLTENLSAPHGWLAFAQLMRAMLIDHIGADVVATEAGERLLSTILGDTFDDLTSEGD